MFKSGPFNFYQDNSVCATIAYRLKSFTVPGLDEPVAGVSHMFHLQVDGCVHGGQDQTVLNVQTGCVHEVQQNGETFGVHFGV